VLKTHGKVAYGRGIVQCSSGLSISMKSVCSFSQPWYNKA
jgi:hypothetical protein